MLKPNYERWLWIELIGFDVDLPDFGLTRFCENAGFVPDCISLLLGDSEFVHGHEGSGDNRILPPTVCSYGAHPYNEERERQVWTAGSLKRLVATLQDKGIRVFFTHFDVPIDGWIAQHPEVFYINQAGEHYPAICMWKRFADGRYYRDWLREQIGAVMRDYGFDGYHAGDGFAHPRLTIYHGDFSDDTIDQYLAWTQLGWPETQNPRTDGDAAETKSRAAWIWEERRLDWIAFYRERTNKFWEQLAKDLHQDGKVLFLNGSWTRDPFEALYRYGIDYSALAAAGVDGFIPETSSACNEYGGDVPYKDEGYEIWDPSRVINRFSLNLMLFSASTPESKLIFMHGVKDTNEAWNGIRHAPTNVESEIYSHTGVFTVQADGSLQSASSGLLVTLADGLAPFEWKWLTKRWDLGYDLHPQGILGAAIYWSDEQLPALVEDYSRTRRVPYTQMLWSLSALGAPIFAAVRSEHLAAWAGPLLVCHPQTLSEEEWNRIITTARGPVLTLGGPPPDVSGADLVLKESHDPAAMVLTIHGWKATLPPLPSSFTLTEDTREQFVDPFFWLYDLPFRPVSPEIMAWAAEAILTMSGAIRVITESEDLRTWAYQIADGRLRVHVRNDGFYYRLANVDIGHELAAVKTLTAFPGNPVAIAGRRFQFKMAGKSMAIFEVTLQ